LKLKVVFIGAKVIGMKLVEARIGQRLTVEQVGGERAFRRRLMELGLVPGTRVEVVGVAPLGDPLKLSVRGCALSIRRMEASAIVVSAIQPSAVKEGCAHAGQQALPESVSLARQGQA
jgi:ferrous iron transport protein A